MQRMVSIGNIRWRVICRHWYSMIGWMRSIWDLSLHVVSESSLLFVGLVVFSPFETNVIESCNTFWSDPLRRIVFQHVAIRLTLILYPRSYFWVYCVPLRYIAISILKLIILQP